MGLKISLDAGLRFDAPKAVADASTLGRLSSDIDDKGIREASRAIARHLVQDLGADDVDHRVAARLADLHKACANWQR